MEFFTIALILLSTAYSILIVVLTVSWFKMPNIHYNADAIEPQPIFYSILIPYRNEKATIKALLHDLQSQSFDKQLFEVILINDESEDGTKVSVDSYILSNKLTYHSLDSLGGKKLAILKGLNQSKGNFIITLDADVRIGTKFIESYDQFYRKTKAKLIAGPVSYIEEDTFINKLFCLEFVSLIAASAGSIGLHRPIMLNAANMGFEKAAIRDFEDDIYKSGIASGDDQFLLEAIQNEYGGESVHYLKSRLAHVKTHGPRTIENFISQRIRWASKASQYKSTFSKLIAILIFLLNLSLLFSIPYAILTNNLYILFYGFGIKYIIDIPLLVSVSSFLDQKKLLWYYPVVQLVYPWYIVGISILSWIKPFNWKGRKYSS